MNKILWLVTAVHLRLVTAREEHDKGATATEYALLVAFVAVVIAVAIGAFGTQLSGLFSAIGGKVANWASAVG